MKTRVLELRSILNATKGSWLTRAWRQFTGKANKARVSELRILMGYISHLPSPSIFRNDAQLTEAYSQATDRLVGRLRTPIDRLDLIALNARPRPHVDGAGLPIAVDSDSLLERELARVLGSVPSSLGPQNN